LARTRRGEIPITAYTGWPGPQKITFSGFREMKE